MMSANNIAVSVRERASVFRSSVLKRGCVRICDIFEVGFWAGQDC